MASNRDPRPSYRRRNRAKPTTSATRKTRVKSSTAPKPTSSSTRSTTKGRAKNRVTSSSDRVTRKPVSGPPRGAQGPRSAPVQGPSQKVSGTLGSRKRYKSPPETKKPKVSRVGAQIKQAQKVKAANPGRAARAARTVARSKGNPLALASAVITEDVMNRGVADGTLKGKPVRKEPSKSVGKYNTKDKDGTVRSRRKVGPKKATTKKAPTKSFDQAFASARKAGKEVFTWKGKRYNTKLK